MTTVETKETVDEFGKLTTVTYNGIDIVFRWIREGSFIMGSNSGLENETPHQVTLTKGYWMSDTTITQELWEAVMGNNPSEDKNPKYPVTNVSYIDVKKFINTFNNAGSMQFDLPTEAQWEYACRAGTVTKYNTGDEITKEQANFRASNSKNTGMVEAKHFKPNNWGLYQMHGNVWEWCKDEWKTNLGSDPVVDPYNG